MRNVATVFALAGFAALANPLMSSANPALSPPDSARPLAAPRGSASPSPTSAARIDPAAAMTISVSDGVSVAAQGDKLTYTISLRNDGTTASGKLGITFRPPAGAELLSVGNSGTREDGNAAWSVEVPAGKTVTLTAAAQVNQPPENANGLAGLACIMRNDSAWLCATDMNQIPGRANIHAEAPKSSADRGIVAWIAGAGGLAVAAVLCAGLVFMVRRRRLQNRF